MKKMRLAGRWLAGQTEFFPFYMTLSSTGIIIRGRRLRIRCIIESMTCFYESIRCTDESMMMQFIFWVIYVNFAI